VALLEQTGLERPDQPLLPDAHGNRVAPSVEPIPAGDGRCLTI
jgi:hypothetical protein